MQCFAGYAYLLNKKTAGFVHFDGDIYAKRNTFTDMKNGENVTQMKEKAADHI